MLAAKQIGEPAANEAGIAGTSAPANEIGFGQRLHKLTKVLGQEVRMFPPNVILAFIRKLDTAPESWAGIIRQLKSLGASGGQP
jgi:hypothetical protein